MGEEKYVNAQDITKDKLCEYLDEVCENYESQKSKIKYNVRLMRNKANENVELLKKLLGEGEK